MALTRALFIFLLLANLLLLALGRGWLGKASRGEPERLAAQIAPEKIRILKPGELPAATAGAARAEAPALALACRRWEGLSREQAQRIAEMATVPGVKAEVAEQAPAGAVSYWVHLPPAASREELQVRIAGLKQVGVTEYFVVADNGPNHRAVSLGLFKVRQQADDLVEQLRAKGVSGMRIETRGAAPKASVQVSGPALGVAALADRAAAQFPDAASSECPAQQ